VKLVCVADVHLHPRKLLSRDGGHDRLMDGLGVLRQSLEVARHLEATWVMAGDFKDPKTSWPQSALTGAHEILRAYDDVQKIMLAGNHDAEGVGGSGLAPFKDCADVIDKAHLAIEYGPPNTRIVFAPWNADLGEVRKMVAKNPGAILVGHAFLQGCMLGPEDARIAKGVPLEAYGNFSFAVFGDVHKGQWREPGAPFATANNVIKARPAIWHAYAGAQVREPGPWAGEVFYCGSPYQQNWGERNDPRKGALVVDVATGAVEMHELKAPTFHHLELDEAGLRTFVETSAHQAYEGGFVRIVFTGAPGPILDKAKKIGDAFRSFQIIPRRPPQKSEVRAELHAGMPMSELLRNYVEARPVPPGVDKKRTLASLLRLTGSRE